MRGDAQHLNLRLTLKLIPSINEIDFEMLSPMTDPFKEQLYAVIVEYKSFLQKSSQHRSSNRIVDLQTRCITAIERIAGRNSVYYERVMGFDKKIYIPNNNNSVHLVDQMGVAEALYSDIQNGYLKSLEEVIHGNLFGDFLEMATHLVETGYKDAAAVLAGSALEVHMRQLCDKYGVETTIDIKPKKSETLNAELVKAGAYEKLDQKNITAWLGLRNYAAHGMYCKYTEEQVKLLIDSIRNFISTRSR